MTDILQMTFHLESKVPASICVVTKEKTSSLIQVVSALNIPLRSQLISENENCNSKKTLRWGFISPEVIIESTCGIFF